MENKSRAAVCFSRGCLRLHRSTLLKVQSRWWDWNYLAALIFVVLSFATGLGGVNRTYAGGEHSFVRSISKTVTPDGGSSFTIGNIDSMTTDYKGNLYVGSGTTIYKFLNNGQYVKQWQTNGQIGKLSFNIYKNLVYKTGDNGIQIFTEDGVETGTVALNGALLPDLLDGSGSIYSWFGVGDENGVATNVRSVNSSILYRYNGDGNLVGQTDLSSDWPQGLNNFYDDKAGAILLSSNSRVGTHNYYGQPDKYWDGDGQSMAYGMASTGRAIYVSDANNNVIHKLDGDMEEMMEWGGYGSSDLDFNNPGEIETSYTGDIFIDDTGNGVIKQYKDTLAINFTNLTNNLTTSNYVDEYIRPGIYFSYTFQTDKESGDTLEFELTNLDGSSCALPAGLSFDDSTGEISGTVDSSVDMTDYSFSCSLKVRSSNGSSIKETVVLRGAELSELLHIETESLPDLQFGQAVDSSYPGIEVSGGQERGLYPVKFSIINGSLPPGLRVREQGYGYGGAKTLNNTGFYGNANTSGTYTFRVRAESTDPLLPSYDEKEYSITVGSPPAGEAFIDLNSGLDSRVVEVERVEKHSGVIVVYGDGPSNQQIKVYMDGDEVGVASSGGDGSWQLSLSGVSEGSHTFSASWDSPEDIMFSLGSDLSYLNTPLTPITTIRIMSMQSGQALRDIRLPSGFFPLDITPRISGSKVYISGIKIDNSQQSGASSKVTILEYDLSGGIFSYVNSVDSMFGATTLRLNADGSLLYVLVGSGLYKIDTTTGAKEFISGVDIADFRLGTRIELNDTEDKVLISNTDYSYGSGLTLDQNVIVIDLVTKTTSVEHLNTYNAEGWYSTLIGRSELMPTTNGFIVAYRNGTAIEIDRSGNLLNAFDFNLDKIFVDDFGNHIGSDETALTYQYGADANALYTVVYRENIVGQDDDDKFYLRKLNLQSGMMESSYDLPILGGHIKIAEPHMAITKDGQSAFLSGFFTGRNTPQPVVGFFVYKLDLVTGDTEVVDYQTGNRSNFLGMIFTSPYFYSTNHSIISNFSARSNNLVVDLSNLSEDPSTPNVPTVVTNKLNDQDESRDDGESTNNAGDSGQAPLAASSESQNRTLNRGENKGTPLIESWLNSVASSLGVEPITLVRVFPWLFIIFLLIMALIALLNLSKQLIVVAEVRKLVRRQELLNLEKTWLLSLSSHYLRTPLTIIKSGQELMPDGFYKDTVVSGMGGLNKKVSGAIDSLRNNQIVATVQAPEPMRYKHASFWRPKVMVPAVLSLALLALVNLVFIVGAKLNPGLIHISSQLCACIVLIGLIYLFYDTNLEKAQLEAYQAQLLKYEQGLDKARNAFVRSIAEELMPEIKEARAFLPEKASEVAKRNMIKGLDQLEATTEKFLLICQLEKEELKKQAAKLGLKDTVAEARAESRHPESPVKLLLSEESTLSQPEVLLKRVFQSLIDNAAEHSDSKFETEVSSKEKGGVLSVAVADRGAGIEEDKLSILFKPFSKVEEDFASQGMGISLYLNRLIMHYLGGEIRATSKVGVGTTMTVDVPKEIS